MVSEEKNKEWMERPPYNVRNADEPFVAKHHGKCHCGKVEYELSRDKPLATKMCHCIDCQLQHSAPCQWAAIFEKTDINFTNGHKNLEWYDPASQTVEHKLPCKVRCQYCHAPIMDEGRNMILLFPALMRLDAEAREKFKPQMHIFYKSRVIDCPDGTPKWSGIDKNSELMSEKE